MNFKALRLIQTRNSNTISKITLIHQLATDQPKIQVISGSLRQKFLHCNIGIIK